MLEPHSAHSTDRGKDVEERYTLVMNTAHTEGEAIEEGGGNKRAAISGLNVT